MRICLIVAAAAIAAAPAAAQNTDVNAVAVPEANSSVDVTATNDMVAPANGVVAVPVEPVLADDPLATAPPPAPASAPRDDDDDLPWGAIGLVGLVGLLGRRRNARDAA